MGTEIERKFLVVGDAWRVLARPMHFRQGYLSSVKERTVRVRLSGDRATLTIKGLTVGATRSEFEYEIPPAEADEILEQLCERPLIEKNRYVIETPDATWEVDEFLGVNQGLVVAEIELADEGQVFDRPNWIGAEVTDDPKYYNANLVARPFSTW